MPTLNQPLDRHGHAIVDASIVPTLARRTALKTANHPVQPPFVGTALIDTGATFTVIDSSVRHALHLVPFRLAQFVTPGTAVPVPAFLYKVDLVIFEPGGGFQLFHPMLSVLEASVVHTGVSVLIGCDVLSRCRFTSDGPLKAFTLAY
jgi:hypothetical protein